MNKDKLRNIRKKNKTHKNKESLAFHYTIEDFSDEMEHRGNFSTPAEDDNGQQDAGFDLNRARAPSLDSYYVDEDEDIDNGHEDGNGQQDDGFDLNRARAPSPDSYHVDEGEDVDTAAKATTPQTTFILPKKREPRIAVPDNNPGKTSKTERLLIKTLNLLSNSGVKLGLRNKDLYVYKEKNGYFQILDAESSNELTLANIITNAAMECHYDDIVFACAKDSFVSLVYKYFLNSRKGVYILGNRPDGYVNFKNGVVDARTLTVKNHDPKYSFTYCIDSKFRVDAEMSRTSKSFFSRLSATRRDYVSLLQSIALAHIGPDTFDRSAFIIGEPNNGKSTYGKLIEYMLPDELCQNLNLSQFGDIFALSRLTDAQVSICHDVENIRPSEAAIANFKNVVTHDTIMARGLYKNFSKLHPRCFLIFLGNHLPVFNDPSGAVERRQWLIKTGPTVPPEERDPKLLQKLVNDRVGIIATAFRAVSEARLLDCPSNVFSNPIKDIEVTCDSSNYDNLMETWCTKHLVRCGNPEQSLPVSLIRNRFKNTLPDNLACQVTESGFTRKLKKFFAFAIFRKKNNVSCLIGFTLKDSDDSQLETPERYSPLNQT